MLATLSTPEFFTSLVRLDIQENKVNIWINSDLLTVQGVSPVVLYNYLLSHEKQYNMEVIRMEPVFLDPNSEFDNEFVLVQISNHKVTYRDHQVKHFILFIEKFFSSSLGSYTEPNS